MVSGNFFQSIVGTTGRKTSTTHDLRYIKDVLRFHLTVCNLLLDLNTQSVGVLDVQTVTVPVLVVLEERFQSSMGEWINNYRFPSPSSPKRFQ